MCKGVAVLVNFNECIIGSGSSHSDEVQNKDDYLALNVIYDDTRKCGYRIEPDTHDDEEVIKHYHNKLFFLKGKPNPKLMRLAMKTIRENEAKVFRILCKNMQDATIKGNQDNYSATIKGNQDNYSATIKGNQDNGFSTIKGNQDNYSATIKGNQDNYSATIKGDQYNGFSTIKGYQDNYSATIKGNIYIYKMKYGSKWLQDKIDKFSRECDSWKDATLENFIKWLVKRANEIEEVRK